MVRRKMGIRGEEVEKTRGSMSSGCRECREKLLKERK